MDDAPPLPPGVDGEHVRALVATSTSWRQVLRGLGLSSAHRRRQVRAWCAWAGVESGHFRQRSFDDETLRRAVPQAASWDELLGLLGLSPTSGSARATVRRHSARLGLSLDTVEAPVAAPGPRAEADLANLRVAGSLLVAAACTLSGFRVSWPLEPTTYDLLIDAAGSSVRRVQVKTTTRWKDGSWRCSLARSEYVAGGGKQRSWYEPGELDDFGLVDGDLRVYLVPVEVLAGRTEVALRALERFVLAPPTPAHRAAVVDLSG